MESLPSNPIRTVGAFRSQHRRARRLLFDTSPRCYWCANLTIWPDFPQAHVGLLFPDTATLDHLVHTRHRSRHAPTMVVLACYACNQFRARLDSYAAKRWPLSIAQFTLLTSLYTAYALRLAGSLADSRPILGYDQLNAEYTTMLASLAQNASLLTASLDPSLPTTELDALSFRISLLSSLPATLA